MSKQFWPYLAITTMVGTQTYLVTIATEFPINVMYGSKPSLPILKQRWSPSYHESTWTLTIMSHHYPSQAILNSSLIIINHHQPSFATLKASSTTMKHPQPTRISATQGPSGGSNVAHQHSMGGRGDRHPVGGYGGELLLEWVMVVADESRR